MVLHSLLHQLLLLFMLFFLLSLIILYILFATLYTYLYFFPYAHTISHFSMLFSQVIYLQHRFLSHITCQSFSFRLETIAKDYYKVVQNEDEIISTLLWNLHDNLKLPHKWYPYTIIYVLLMTNHSFLSIIQLYQLAPWLLTRQENNTLYFRIP